MTHDEHRKRHKKLHRALDELFADFIRHHPERTLFLTMPLGELIEWAYQQSIEPSEVEDPQESKA